MSEIEKYVSVDIEASGPTPGEYSMLQIGACLVTNPEKGFEIMLKPLNDNVNDWVRQNLSHLWEKSKNEGIEPERAMKRFAEWLEKNVNGKPIFVGFNACWDYKFVDWYFWKYLGYNPFGINGLDIKAVFMGIFSSNWRDTAKSNIKRTLELQSKHTHDALEDAQEQAEIFRFLLEIMGKLPPQLMLISKNEQILPQKPKKK